MAFCSKCGAQMEDGAAFCPSCGASAQAQPAAAPAQPEPAAEPVQPTAAQPAAAPVQPAAAPAAEAAPEFTQEQKDSGKVMAILSYFGFLALIPYFAEKENPFVRYHAVVGINILILEVIISVISMIPILGWIIGFVGGIILFVIAIMGIIQAVKGEAKELPIIGKLKIIKK